MVFLGDLDDPLGVLIEAGVEAVHFHDEHRAGIEWKPEMERRLDRFEDQMIEHLESAGNDAGADDVADRVGRVVHGFEDA